MGEAWHDTRADNERVSMRNWHLRKGSYKEKEEEWMQQRREEGECWRTIIKEKKNEVIEENSVQSKLGFDE